MMDGQERAAMRESLKALVDVVETLCDGVRAERRNVAAHLERAQEGVGRASRILGPDAVQDLHRRLIEAQARLGER